jgi:predicted RNA-binding protein associated with RNAse of E/G family
MAGLPQITSGDWQSNPQMSDYRSQLLDKMFVERATWRPSASVQHIGDTVVSGPGYVWVRFWLLEYEEPIAKYFDASRQPIGFYIPLCMPIQRRAGNFFTTSLLLALWLQLNGRLVVMGEHDFEQAVATGDLAPIEVEHAEFRIRALTLEIHQKRFPPGMVRTFALADEPRR